MGIALAIGEQLSDCCCQRPKVVADGVDQGSGGTRVNRATGSLDFCCDELRQLPRLHSRAFDDLDSCRFQLLQERLALRYAAVRHDHGEIR